MAFGGAFSVAGEILRKSGIALDVSKKFSEQKAVLAMVAGADVTAALGVSYGISAWTGEKWTVQEALQAALMAAAFRGVMIGAERMKFRAVRDPDTGAPTLVRATPVESAPVVAQASDNVALAVARGEASPIKGAKYRIGAEEFEYIGTNARKHHQFKNSVTGDVITRAEFARRVKAQNAEPVPEAVPETQSAAPAEIVPNLTDAGFKRFANDLVGRLKKVGSKVEADGYSIVRNADGYEVKIGEKTLRVDTPEMAVKEIVEKVSQPHARAEFLAKFASDALKKRFDALHRKELGDDFRLTSENGVFGFEKKAGNGWEKVPAENVPEAVRTKAGEIIFGSKALERARGALAKIAAKPEKLASTEEKNWFIKKFGEKNWITAMQKFEAKVAGKGEGGHDPHHPSGGR